MNRHLGTTLRGLLLPTLAAALIGCGASDDGVVPKVENPFAAAWVGSDTTFEVMTWNLQNFAKNGDATVEYLIDAVSGLDVDVVALQEIQSGSAFSAVVAGLEGWSGHRAVGAYDNLNLAFLYRDSPGDSLEVTAIYQILAGLKADDPFPRDPLVLELEFRGTPLVIINNHLKCCGDGTIELDNPDDDETRRLNANLLLQSYIETNLAGRRVIVLGDFNDELDDPAGGNVFANFLDDPDHYRFVDLSIALDRDALWSYPSWPSHIDHILITQPLFAAQEAQTALVQVVPLHTYLPRGLSEYDLNLSDHLPVLLRLQP